MRQALAQSGGPELMDQDSMTIDFNGHNPLWGTEYDRCVGVEILDWAGY